MHAEVRPRSLLIYSPLALGIACCVAGLLTTLFAGNALGGPLAASIGGLLLLVGGLFLVMFFRVRSPIVLTIDRFSLPALGRRSEFELSRVAEARWSVSYRSPKLLLRSAHTSARIRLTDYSFADQLLLLRYFRNYLPLRAQRDWYRICRYGVFVRRQVMVEARDDRTPRQRGWETICKWIGVTTGAMALSALSEDAGRDYFNLEMQEEIARNAIPHEALSDTEWNERWNETVAWVCCGLAICLLCATPWIVGRWRLAQAGAVLLLTIVAIVGWRRQAQVEDEIARETFPDVNARWELAESKLARPKVSGPKSAVRHSHSA